MYVKSLGSTVLAGHIQDEQRENEMRELFELLDGGSRGGTDAFLDMDEHQVAFELKSVTKKAGKNPDVVKPNASFSTVRDLGPDHIAKWRAKMHWLLSRYNADGKKLLYTYYATPEQMGPWLEEKEAYMRPDFELSRVAPARLVMADLHRIIGKKSKYTIHDAHKLQKDQYTRERYFAKMDLDGLDYSAECMLEILRERCAYVIERGSTLNNPHIPESYFVKQGCVTILNNHAKTLRKLVRGWLAT